ncbi:MAG: DHH family phosphoesterase [Methylobacter sp.]
MNYDVFNGDADGICALIQLRLNQPRETQLVTGVKRDILLLDKFTVNAGDHVTVLDISLQTNSARVREFLDRGADIFYVDHHQAGEIPNHPNLKALIDTDSRVCTSLLVNRHLNGKYPLWAVAAAFGDNLNASAEQLAATLSLKQTQLDTLQELGICINYNGYGGSLDDLYFTPDRLYLEMSGFSSPFDFIAAKPGIFEQLKLGYREDMDHAQSVTPEYQNSKVAAYVLPDTAWARRVNGVFGNFLANVAPERAHAVITQTPNGDYQVSVRAPLSNRTGADELCASFPTGGGRKAAAGINHLPSDKLDNFITKFADVYS